MVKRCSVCSHPSRPEIDLGLMNKWPYRSLAAHFGLTPSALSRHLRTLKAGGLIEEAHPEFDARVRIYSLKSGAMAELKDWLAVTEQLWSDQLGAFKAHLERKP